MLVVRTDSRSGIWSSDYQNVFRMGGLSHFLRYGATLVSDHLTALKLFSLVSLLTDESNFSLLSKPQSVYESARNVQCA